MSLFVVDASVGIKWFLPETFQADAQRLQNPAFQLHVPSLFDAETGNILWKKVRRGELTRAEADSILTQVSSLPLTRHLDSGLLSAAFDIAVQTQRSVYDSLYVALAVHIKGKMVTADQKFFHALSTSPWANYLCWIEAVP